MKELNFSKNLQKNKLLHIKLELLNNLIITMVFKIEKQKKDNINKRTQMRMKSYLNKTKKKSKNQDQPKNRKIKK